jgi:hypothetical protein
VLTRRVGELRSLIIACGANAVIYVGIGLAPSAWPAGPLVAGALLAANGFAVTMWNVVTVTMRQRVVPTTCSAGSIVPTRCSAGE